MPHVAAALPWPSHKPAPHAPRAASGGKGGPSRRHHGARPRACARQARHASARPCVDAEAPCRRCTQIATRRLPGRVATALGWEAEAAASARARLPPSTRPYNSCHIGHICARMSAAGGATGASGAGSEEQQLEFAESGFVGGATEGRLQGAWWGWHWCAVNATCIMGESGARRPPTWFRTSASLAFKRRLLACQLCCTSAEAGARGATCGGYEAPRCTFCVMCNSAARSCTWHPRIRT